MKQAWVAPLLMVSGCLEVNPDRVRPDMAMGMPDLMCSQGPGVNAKSRAEVMVPAGNGPVGGTGSYAVAAFYLVSVRYCRARLFANEQAAGGCV